MTDQDFQAKLQSAKALAAQLLDSHGSAGEATTAAVAAAAWLTKAVAKDFQHEKQLRDLAVDLLDQLLLVMVSPRRARA